MVGSLDVVSSDAHGRISSCESTTFKFDVIDEEDVLRLMRSLEPNKAESIDGIGGKILRAVVPGDSASLTSLVYLRSGRKYVGPMTRTMILWCTQVVMVSLWGSYRPVSVLPVVTPGVCSGVKQFHLSVWRLSN